MSTPIELQSTTNTRSTSAIHINNSPSEVTLKHTVDKQQPLETQQSTIAIPSQANRSSVHKSAKSFPSSSKTPKSSSITAFHSRNFRIKTCCGVLELNFLKVLSFGALIASLVAFLALIIIISINFSIVYTDYTSLSTLETTGGFYRDLMVTNARIAVLSQYNRTLSLEYVKVYNEYYIKYFEIMNKIIASVPPSILYWNKHNISREATKTRRAMVTEVTMMSQVTAGNYSVSLSTLDSEYYMDLLSGYAEEGKPIIDYVTNQKSTSSDSDMITTSIALIIIVISLFLVVPVLIAYVCLSLKKDNTKEKQLRQVRKYMIMDTMNDSSLCEKFKDFCKMERSEENFKLLEKINEYKKQCEKSFDIQVYLYDDIDGLSSSEQISESNSSATEESTSKKKKIFRKYSEKDLMDIEKKKFEIAFEIYTEFLDVRGDFSVNISKQLAENVKQHLDFFANGENESMPENVFESIEYEMCILMMDTHHRFKQFMEVSVKEKKTLFSTLKKK